MKDMSIANGVQPSVFNLPLVVWFLNILSALGFFLVRRGACLFSFPAHVLVPRGAFNMYLNAFFDRHAAFVALLLCR